MSANNPSGGANNSERFWQTKKLLMAKVKLVVIQLSESKCVNGCFELQLMQND